VRRTYSETTIRSYLHAVEAFRQHVGKRLDHLGPDDLRRYQVYLLEDRKLANGTVVIQISALRFFYIKVLKRRDMKEDLPYPKRLKRLPVVLKPRGSVPADRLCPEPVPSSDVVDDVRRRTQA
jgi:site-specific recombinase XerD